MKHTDSSAPDLLGNAAHAEDLIPGLPNCVILQCILPRLPWHTRPALVATSKAWKCTLQLPHIYSKLSRRIFDGLLQKGVVVLHQLSDTESLECSRKMNTKRPLQRPHALSIIETTNPRCSYLNMDPTDHIRMWRRLPPIPAFAPLRILHESGIACLDGKIFVMGGWHSCTNAMYADMYMLDIAAGLWMWESMPPMNFPRAFFHCIASAGKIYIVGGISVSHPEPDPEVYNVDTGRWELLPRVVMSRTVYYNGATFIKGTDLVVTHGFCTTERGELVRFKRIYNPEMCSWCDYEGEDEADDVDGVDDVKDCLVAKYADVGGLASKHGSGATESVALLMPRDQTRVIMRVMMK